MLTLCLCLFSCGKVKEPEVIGELSIAENEEMTLKASRFDSLVGKTVTWSSSDEKIVKIVDGNKMVGVYPGTVTINARYPDKRDREVLDYVAVTVTPVLPTGIEITGKSELINKTSLELTYRLLPSNATQDVTWHSTDESIATVNETGIVTGVKAGTTTIEAISKRDSSVKATHEVTVLPVTVSVSGSTDLVAGGSTVLTATVNPKNATQEVTWESSNKDIATIDENGKVTAFNGGVVKFKAISKLDNSAKGEIEMIIKHVNVQISGPSVIVIGEDQSLVSEVTPSGSSDVIWSSSDETIATVTNGLVKGLKAGKVDIIARTTADVDGSDTFTVTIIEPDYVKPILSFDSANFELDRTVQCGKSFDLLEGFSATDDVDGDITNLIEYDGNVNFNARGTYQLKYFVKDLFGNVSNTITRNITTIWDYDLTFIGHGGCYTGVMNTEEAFINAVTIHGYTALECDLATTKDGVFVLDHGDNTTGICYFAGKTIAQTNYADLEKLTETEKRGGIEYTYKLCTLERYLEICKQYNAIAVIELKWNPGINNDDTSNMPKLMKAIKDAGLLNQCILIGSAKECLVWTRNNGYDYIPCQWFVGNAFESEDSLAYATKYNLDPSINISLTYKDAKGWIQKYHDAGLKVSSWTYSQYVSKATLQIWINRGVDYVTVDKLLPSEVTFE